jgi:ribosomal protein S17E
MPKSSIGPLAAAALKYSVDNYIFKKYTSDPGYYHPILYRDHEGKIKYSKNYIEYQGLELGSVFRSNHGVCHTARTLQLVRNVMDYNLKHANDKVKGYIQSQTSTEEEQEKFITKLQIAMAFYVSGRGGEEGWGNELYNKYRQQSAENFKEYVKKQNLIPVLFRSEQ